jgi:hypothetical protein
MGRSLYDVLRALVAPSITLSWPLFAASAGQDERGCSRGAVAREYRRQSRQTANRSPDGAERNPGTIAKLQCRSRITLRFIRATNLKARFRHIREAERRQAHCRQSPHASGARVAPRIRRLAPPFPLSGALACRRSTSALAAATERHRSAPATRFPGRNSIGTGVIRSLPSYGTAGDNTRRPVIVPAGRIDPEPPESGGDSPPAGTAFAPAIRRHPNGVP